MNTEKAVQNFFNTLFVTGIILDLGLTLFYNSTLKVGLGRYVPLRPNLIHKEVRDGEHCMLRRVEKSFLFLSFAPMRVMRLSVLYAFVLLCTVVLLQPNMAFCNEHAAHGEHVAHGEHSAHAEAIGHEEHEHSENVEHAVHGEHEKHVAHGERAEQEAHGSIALNIVHWCFLFFLMFVAVKSLLSKLVFKEEDKTMKSYGALVLMVIFLYAYEQIPGMAHYHDSAFWGFLKFILKMFTGICLTVIGIIGMHEHGEDDEHGHSAAHH